MYLQSVKKGKLADSPHVVLIYGPPGVGKSSFGAAAPNPIFMDVEEGTEELSVERLPKPRVFADVLGQIQELTVAQHDYKTLVIDSLDWIEPLVWDQVCQEDGKSNIELVGGGFAKGYIFALKKWGAMRDRLIALRQTKKMHIILIAHSQIKKFDDPTENANYDRYQIKLHEKAAALWREYCKAVLFANYETFIKVDENNKRKQKAFADGARVMWTERRPGFDAKNRMNLPFKMPLSWESFEAACKQGRKPEEVLANIEELLKEVTDEELVKKISGHVMDANGDLQKLIAFENRLRTIVGG